MRFYLIGLAIFAVFSIACSLAFSGPFLIAARSLQGAGAAFMAATSPALVTAVFPPEERGRGLGLNAMAGYLGLMAGPPIGGLIVDHASWRWIFLINVPLAIITLVNGWFLLGAERRDRVAARERSAAERRVEGQPAPAAAGAGLATGIGASLDWAGTALLGLLLVSLLVPLISVPFWGWLNPLTLVLLAAFVVFLAAFIVVKSRLGDPLLNLDLVRKNRVFAAGTSARFSTTPPSTG